MFRKTHLLGGLSLLLSPLALGYQPGVMPYSPPENPKDIEASEGLLDEDMADYEHKEGVYGYERMLKPIYSRLRLGFGVSAGSRIMTIGEPYAPIGAAQNLLGNRKKTTSVTPTGTVTQLSHSTPVAVLNAHVQFCFSRNSIFKFGTDVYLSRSDSYVIHDGRSTTGSVDIYGSKFRITLTDAVFAEPSDPGDVPADAVVNQVPTAGIGTVTPGRRECTVEHQAAYGVNLKYSYGQESKFSAGIGLLHTSDIYKYLVDEPPTGGEGSGVYNASDTDFSENLAFGDTTADWAETKANYYNDGDNWENPGDAISTTISTVAGTQAKYEDNIYWFGVVGDTASEITQNIILYSGFGYYWKDLPESKDATLYAPMIVKTTKARLLTGHVGITFKRAQN